MATHRSDADPKLLGLELLRFLSAVAVLVWHYQHFWFVGDAPDPAFVRAEQPLYPALKLFYEWGVYGVQVFWFISGFIFFWKYLGPIAEGRVGGWRFFVLRASRLYPLHLATFLLVAALQLAYHARTGRFHVYQANDGFHALLQLFMASNWGLQAGDSFNGPIWSVSLEVLAYALFFVFARRLAGPGWARTALWTAVIAAVAAVAYQLKLGQVFQCVFCFFVGGLAALAGRSEPMRRHEAAIVIAALAWIFGLAVVCRTMGWFERKWVVHLYLTTAAPLAIVVLSRWSRWPGALARAVTVAGNTTYSSYLLHFPLQMALMLGAAATGWRLPREQPAFLLAYLGVSLALGVLVFRVFEVPMQEWLRSAAGLRQRPAEAAGGGRQAVVPGR